MQVRVCPKCYVSILRVRSDLPHRHGWVSCDTCGYAEKEKKEKDEKKQGNSTKTGERN